MRFGGIKSLMAAFMVVALPYISRGQNKPEGDLSPMTVPEMLQSFQPISIAPEKGVQISYPALAKIALEHADVLFCGDTNHGNSAIQDLYYLEEALIAYRNAGVRRLMIEADSAAAERIESSSDERIFLKVSSALLKTEKEVRAAEIDKTLLFNQFQIARLHGFDFCGIDTQSEREKDFIKHYLQGTEQDIALYRRMKLDTVLFQNLKRRMEGDQKAVMVYGADHGSRYGDLFLEDESISMIKISAYPDRGAYISNLVSNLNAKYSYMALFERIGFPYDYEDVSSGDDVPHMIYFIDTGTVFFSDKAAPEFIAAVKTASAAQIEQHAMPSDTLDFKH